jgi:Ca2+-binding EF-hand superfamily protein
LQEVQELQQKVKLVEQADSKQMAHLFRAFDRNHDGKVDLAELTIGLKKFKPDASANAARSSALDVLLLFDKNDSRYDADYNWLDQTIR